MVQTCVVSGCKKEQYPGCGISFHRLPVNEDLRSKWMEAMHRSGTLSKWSSVCHLHFKDEDFITGPYVKRRLKPEAIPTIIPKVHQKQRIENLKEETTADDEDFENDNTPSETTSIHEVEIKEEIEDEIEENEIFIESTELTVKTEPDPLESNEEQLNHVIGHDHSYDVPVATQPLPVSVIPATNQKPPTFAISPLLSSLLTSRSVAPSTQDGASPTMLIGPLPASHLPSKPVTYRTSSADSPLNNASYEMISMELLREKSINAKNKRTLDELRQKVKVLHSRMTRRNLVINKLKSEIKMLKSRKR